MKLQPNKIPKTARGSALHVLWQVEEDKAYSNIALNQRLQHVNLSLKDSALTTEIVYGTLQFQNVLDNVLNTFVSKGVKKLHAWVRCLLRMSAYQFMYLDKIPDHAIVNEAVNIAKKIGHSGISGMVNGVLRNMIRNREDLHLPTSTATPKEMALTYAHPQWMIQKWVKQYGKEVTERICYANNQSAKLSIRVNINKTDRTTLFQWLEDNGYEPAYSSLSPVGMVLNKGTVSSLTNTSQYENGHFTIQDESSMLVADVVDPQPGMMVLDMCAAPGGKATHIAEKMQGKGTVYANDIHPHKQQLMDQQAARLGLHHMKTKISDAANLSEKWNEPTFDVVLLDAPCSGLGVMRRKPEMKWTKSEKEIAALPAIQLELLREAAKLVKSGGDIVYSTCTMIREENEKVIAQFLEEHDNITLSDASALLQDHVLDTLASENKMIQILPHHFNSDGFFIARLHKK
ncbi:16S rRNA (cytosine(967)-C(5))-methyltransferase RsmB [Longirhabdus pacifica]|uniref:16S rRNA (cytosine(967)-C(5))-methyltransferase RsmB n=1 Tax=Longirhabdus pacifica TaxID=2305227 RepID=UPI0010091B47|nr:16S rRNA (cytosine(967)-C(5))-methyltransferase RsmB [Longirhabdus pacifica]